MRQSTGGAHDQVSDSQRCPPLLSSKRPAISTHRQDRYGEDALVIEAARDRWPYPLLPRQDRKRVARFHYAFGS